MNSKAEPRRFGFDARPAVERRSGLVSFRAVSYLAIALAALQLACGDWTGSDTQGTGGNQGIGILASQHTDSRQHRFCTYSDGFILTVGSLETCPLTD